MFSNLLNNQILQGALGALLVGALLYTLRAIPKAIWDFITWQFTSVLVVYNEDPAFEIVNNWLANHPRTKQARRIRMTTIEYYDGRENTIVFSLGIGTHLIFYENRPVLIQRVAPTNQGTSWKRREDLVITTLGKSPKLLQNLCQEVLRSCREMLGSTVDVFVFHDRWRLIGRRTKRSLDSVIIPQDQKDALLKDINKFRASRERYHNLGIPYHRGYCFEGPPGTGKTSLAFAIASHFSMPIYTLNLGSLKSDDQLLEAHLSVPDHALFLLEDIDATHAKRVEVVPKKEATNGAPTAEAPRGITLSALLNCIDGVLAKDGRLLIMTTNYPDRIDPALIREGRVDRRERFKELTPKEAQIMCERFLPKESVEAFLKTLPRDLTAAALQGHLLKQLDQATADAT